MTDDYPRNVLTFTPQQQWKYPDGAMGIRLPKGSWPDQGLFRIQTSEDLMSFIMAMNGREEGSLTHVTIPFLPYARQDRVAVLGDPDAAAVLCKLLASTGVQRITSLDVHSAAAMRWYAPYGIVFNSVSPVDYLSRYIQDVAADERIILVSPDKGALKKTFNYALAMRDRVDGVVVCNKQRDPISGRLMLFGVEGYYSRADIDIASVTNHTEVSKSKIPDGGTLVIADDICDGGGTFGGVLEGLTATYGKRPVHLWTTHGIYSKGIDRLLAQFATIGSTNSFLSTAPSDARRFLYEV